MYTTLVNQHIHTTCMYMYVYPLDRFHGLSEGMVSDVGLHEQPTGLNPVQRTSLYTKKLTWGSKLKPPRSFVTATSSVSAIRHRLGSSSKRKGTIAYFMNSTQAIMLLDTEFFLIVWVEQAHQSSTVSSSTAPPSHVTDIVDHVISNVAKLRSVQ